MSIDEYLDMEATSADRHEFLDGRVWVQNSLPAILSTGSDLNHARICSSLSREFGIRIKGTENEYFGLGMPFLPDVAQVGLYPDAMIVCGEPQILSRGTDAILNPTVIFEVLSPTTEAYDRGKKLDLSANAQSLKEYILISQDEARIESFARRDDGSWIRRLYVGLEASLHLESVEIDLPLAEVYERVNFVPADDPKVQAPPIVGA